MSEHIKIPPVQPYTQYIANGTQNAFHFLFPIFQSGDIAVFINDEQKIDDFTVSGAGDTEGGIVTFDITPESGTKITLRRQLNCARVTDFQESGEFRAKAINDELDYLTALIQQVADENGRSIRISATDAIGNLTIPNSELRAGKAIGFDINGDVTVFHAGLTEAIAWKTLDDIPDGVNNVRFSAVQREKLATIELGAQANATQISQTERSSGIEQSLRSFSPHDVAEMVRSFAPAGSLASVFGRSGAVVAQSGDYTAAQISNTPAGGIGATTVQAAINELDTEKAASGHNHNTIYAPLTHVGAGTTAHAAATTSAAGFLSAADKAKLDGIAAAATANPNAIETSSAGEIAALTEKVTPVSGDVLLIEDSAAGYAKKKTTIGNLPAAAGTNITATESPTNVAIASSTGSGDTIALATGVNAGVMAPADKTKLDGIATGAQVNAVASVFGRTGAVTAATNDYTATQVANVPAGNISAANVQAAINELDAEKSAVGHNHDSAYAPLSHVGTGGAAHANAIAGGAAGFMTGADKTKLDGIATSATANPNAIETSSAGEIAALTEKVTPVSGDVVLIEDSEAGNAKKKVQIGNLPGGGGGLSEAQVDARIALLATPAIYDPDATGLDEIGVVTAATWATMTGGEKAGRVWFVV